MARKLNLAVPDIGAPDATRLEGYILDEDAGVVGTPVLADMGNDQYSFFSALMYNAGATHNNIVDNTKVNQYFDVFDAWIIKRNKEYGTELGTLEFIQGNVKSPAAWSVGSPTAYFNKICLDAIETYEDISNANWPDLVPYLRAQLLKYNDGITGAKSAYDVTAWAISSNVATLTFANTTAENAILAALAEDQIIHGSYTNYRSITLPSAIGDIDAGEYAITNINTGTRTVSFVFNSGNNSGSGSFVVNFYENRIPGSTTTARLYQATARSLVSANDADGEEIAGLRRRDRFQGHWHNLQLYSNGTTPNAASGIPPYGTAGVLVELNKVKDATTDGTNGTPRTGTTTDPRMLVGHMYIHGGEYAA